MDKDRDYGVDKQDEVDTNEYVENNSEEEEYVLYDVQVSFSETRT